MVDTLTVPLPTRPGNLTPSREPAAGQEGRRFDHGKNGKHGRDAGGRQGGVTRRDVGGAMSELAGFLFLWTSVVNDGLASQSPSKQTNTAEQKDAKIAKKSKAGNYVRRFQHVFQRRPQPPLEALSALFLRDLCDLLVRQAKSP